MRPYNKPSANWIEWYSINSFSFTKYNEWYIAILQIFWHFVTSLFQFSVYCFPWLVNMGCGTKLSPNIFFLVVKMFSVTKKKLTMKVCQKISPRWFVVPLDFVAWFGNYDRKENYTKFLKVLLHFNLSMLDLFYV